MRTLDINKTYRKDLKGVLKQGWDAEKINNVVLELLANDILSSSLKDHPLKGDLKDFRECHIFGDLVIIYKRNDTELHLYRIGRHQDLFKNY